MTAEASHTSQPTTPMPEQLGLLADDPEEQRIPYEILKSPEDRMRYLQLTDNLVREMVENKTDTVIFFDKSARPVAWMIRQFWDQLAPPPKPGQKTRKQPDIKFLNVDREQWGAITGRTEDGMVDVDEIPQERITELQQVMSSVPSTGLEKGVEPDPDKSWLAGKHVMVVDEVRVSGDTLHMSQRILKRAFPEAEEIVPVAWMEGQPVIDPRSGQRANKNNPIWYTETKVTGRGVGDRDTTKAAGLHSETSKIGRYWLSTPFDEPDMEGMQLRREVGQMARDLQHHRLLYRPAPWKKDTDPIDKRIERINGISVEDYKELRMNSHSAEELFRELGRLAGRDKK